MAASLGTASCRSIAAAALRVVRLFVEFAADVVDVVAVRIREVVVAGAVVALLSALGEWVVVDVAGGVDTVVSAAAAAVAHVVAERVAGSDGGDAAAAAAAHPHPCEPIDWCG